MTNLKFTECIFQNKKIEVEIQKEKRSQNNPKKILILHKKIKQFKWKKGWPNLK